MKIIKEKKKEFYNDDANKTIIRRLNRLFLYGILGIAFSLYILLTEESISFLIIAYLLLFVSTIYLISSFRLRHKEIINYINKLKK